MSQRTEEEREEIRRLVIESRRRQGLPDTIQDPVFLSRIAAILLETDPVDLPTPDSNGEVPPQPEPGEPGEP